MKTKLVTVEEFIKTLKYGHLEGGCNYSGFLCQESVENDI